MPSVSTGEDAAITGVATMALSFERFCARPTRPPGPSKRTPAAVVQHADHPATHGMPGDVTALTREHIESYIVELLEDRLHAAAL